MVFYRFIINNIKVEVYPEVHKCKKWLSLSQIACLNPKLTIKFMGYFHYLGKGTCDAEIPSHITSFISSYLFSGLSGDQTDGFERKKGVRSF